MVASSTQNVHDLLRKVSDGGNFPSFSRRNWSDCVAVVSITLSTQVDDLSVAIRFRIDTSNPEKEEHLDTPALDKLLPLLNESLGHSKKLPHALSSAAGKTVDVDEKLDGASDQVDVWNPLLSQLSQFVVFAAKMGEVSPIRPCLGDI